MHAEVWGDWLEEHVGSPETSYKKLQASNHAVSSAPGVVVSVRLASLDQEVFELRLRNWPGRGCC